jgi:hypothetical protein
MVQPLDQFAENVGRARSLVSLSLSVEKVTAGVIDATDLLRASIVLAGAALDHFVHEVTRAGMVDMYRGVRPTTPAFVTFRVPLAALQEAIADPTSDTWLYEAVREAHGWVSFQRPEKIAEAIRLVSHVRLWDEVGKQLRMSTQDVKVKLSVIIDRRNKIAHEADMDPTRPGERWPISSALADEAIDFIEALGRAIALVV